MHNTLTQKRRAKIQIVRKWSKNWTSTCIEKHTSEKDLPVEKARYSLFWEKNDLIEKMYFDIWQFGYHIFEWYKN